MEINIKKNKSIELGDIVEHENIERKNFLCMVIFDENSEFCYAIVSLDNFKIIDGWRTLGELALECELVEKNNNLKLEVI